jgi:hypothetical protein
MMAEVNKWSVVYLSAAILATQEVWQLSAFVQGRTL